MSAVGEGAFPADEEEGHHDSEAKEATKEGAEKNGEEGTAQSQEGAHHSHHFDVTHTHALALSNKLVENGGAPEEEAAEGGSEKGFEYADENHGKMLVAEQCGEQPIGQESCCEGESQAKPEGIDGVGQNTHADVGDGQDDQQTTKDQEFESRQGEPKSAVGENEKGTGQEFHDRVHR